MRFAHTAGSVYEQGAERGGLHAGHRQGGGVRELVALSHDEVFELVPQGLRFLDLYWSSGSSGP